MTPEESVRHFAGIVRHSTITKSTATGARDQIAGRAGRPGPRQPPPHDVRRLWPFGIRSVPPVGCEAAVVFANGDPAHGLLVGAESPKYGSAELVEGDVEIYCKHADTHILLSAEDGSVTIANGGGAKVTIDHGGNILLTTAAGKQVSVNGGTKTVNRHGDGVNASFAFGLWGASVRSSLILAGAGDPGAMPGGIGLTDDGSADLKTT